MLKYAKWTTSHGYNIEKGKGGRNVNIGDKKTYSFNETVIFWRVSQMRLSMIVGANARGFPGVNYPGMAADKYLTPTQD